MSAEWELISKRKEFLYFNHSHFIGEKYSGMEAVNCSLSWSGEAVYLSAYLRTICFAYSKNIMSEGELHFYINFAMPFNKPFALLAPSKSPDIWPPLDLIKMFGNDFDEINFKKFVGAWDISETIPLIANGPISCSKNNVEADICCKVVVCEKPPQEDQDAKMLFGEQDGSIAYHLADNEYPAGTGRWQTEILSRGYSHPFFATGEPPHSILFNADTVDYRSKNEVLCTWRYWFQNWFPARRRELGCNLGTSLTCPLETFKEVKSNIYGHLYLVVRLKIAGRDIGSDDKLRGEYYTLRAL